MLESKFIKFLISVLKWQVNSSSNFALFFIVMTHNSSVNFKVIPFLLWTKGSHQSPNFDTFKCSGEICQISQVFFQTIIQFFFKICITLQCRERRLLYTFVAQTIYTLVTRRQLKHNFVGLSSAWVKICEVLYVSFKTTSQFLFNFCIILHCHDT